MLLQRKRDLVEFSQLLLTIVSLSVNFNIWKMLKEFRGTGYHKSTHSEIAAVSELQVHPWLSFRHLDESHT